MELFPSDEPGYTDSNQAKKNFQKCRGLLSLGFY